MKEPAILKQFPWAVEYVHYLQLRNKGLRKKALETLRLFFESFEIQSAETRRVFIMAIYEIAFTCDNYNLYIPYNLSQVFASEIKEWIKDEPENPDAYKWSFESDHLKKALTLAPTDQIILQLYGQMTIKGIAMNQHETPTYPYDGYPAKDLEEIIFFNSFINNVKDEKVRAEFSAQIKILKDCALQYLGYFP
jgi:hypothetical protein